jgi:hypothetical protein
MYRADLSPYEPCRFEPWPEATLLSVGWIEAGHEFPVGEVPEALTDKLLRLIVRKPEAVTRGTYYSKFLRSDDYRHYVEVDGKQYALGAAEIRVPGNGNIVYACPNLVYLYIVELKYRPPDEFLRALEAMSV